MTQEFSGRHTYLDSSSTRRRSHGNSGTFSWPMKSSSMRRRWPTQHDQGSTRAPEAPSWAPCELHATHSVPPKCTVARGSGHSFPWTTHIIVRDMMLGLFLNILDNRSYGIL
eukprot:9469095-Pyramimonas_sp.AAC.1